MANDVKSLAHTKWNGKQWNGPYDYIEIGNYGDTKSFYIIGELISE